MRARSRLFVFTTRSCASVVPKKFTASSVALFPFKPQALIVDVEDVPIILLIVSYRSCPAPFVARSVFVAPSIRGNEYAPSLVVKVTPVVGVRRISLEEAVSVELNRIRLKSARIWFVVVPFVTPICAVLFPIAE